LLLDKEEYATLQCHNGFMKRFAVFWNPHKDKEERGGGEREKRIKLK
jgi:hypothetical protein